MTEGISRTEIEARRCDRSTSRAVFAARLAFVALRVNRPLAIVTDPELGGSGSRAAQLVRFVAGCTEGDAGFFGLVFRHIVGRLFRRVLGCITLGSNGGRRAGCAGLGRVVALSARIAIHWRAGAALFAVDFAARTRDGAREEDERKRRNPGMGSP